MTNSLSRILVAIGARLPLRLTARLFQLAVGDASVAICLHRVGNKGERSAMGQLHCHPDNLDELLRALLATRSLGRSWLTITFDDGYLDALEYVGSRAPSFPTIEWIVFVCPEKAEREAGFSWDIVGANSMIALPPMNIETENTRPELLLAGRAESTRVASVPVVRALSSFPNVALGNHTNTHARLTLLSRAELDGEYTRSIADFERLFGLHRHFAFPFGTPHHEVTAAHVLQLWRHAECEVWTTENRTYTLAERASGAPLPRFSPDGRWRASSMALWMAAHALRQRLFRRPPAFGIGLVRKSAAVGEVAELHPTTSETAATRA